MAEIPKWKTKPFTIVGWITFGMFTAIVAVDIILALVPDLPTISQYVSRRAEDQPLFAYIIISIFVGLAIHWFWGRIGKKK